MMSLSGDSPVKQNNKKGNEKVTRMDTPLSESYVTLKLCEIQERFVELMQQEFSDLQLEDPEVNAPGCDPYNQNR